MLPFRFSILDGMTFAELVKAAQTLMLDGAEHQQLSYGALLKQLAIKRDPSRLPLINVVFNLDQAAQGNELGFAGVDVHFLTNPRHFENFELFINASETRGETVLEVQYNTDLFDRETVTRWLSSMQMLLESAASAPNSRVDSLNLLAPSVRDKLLRDWNATARDFALDTTVHELLEAQVDRTPDAVALQFGETKLTYLELDARSNQLARYLRGLGVGPDRLVAIYAERSIEMVVGMIAVHKAGGAYVPLDPNYPQERVSFIQKDADAAILLTQASLATKLSREAKLTVIELDTDWPEIAKVSQERLERTASAHHLSHVIYTSGSTGLPKGVAIEHRNTVNFCHWASQAFTAVQRDGVLFSTSICFDLSVFELFATLAWGGRVVLVENALALATLPQSANVRLVNSVPSVLVTVLKTVALPASVQTVNLAGEPLKDDLVRQLYDLPSIKDVVDLYGPSETTTYSTFTRRVAGARPTIGRPLSNTMVYVLDARLQLLPQGLPGELFIGGAGVARGYLGRAELTAERFLADPFASESGARMYRTGDLVRWLPDGTLEYLGRTDHQVKIRGFRVELGEIESVLSTHPVVREAAIMAREDVPGDVRIVAYVVPKDGQDYADMALRKHLRKSLPDYMIPQYFVELGKLPLTPNGKLDRKALPAPAGAVADARMVVAPHTDDERLLAELFQETLKVGGVSVHDNFFDLGGHSLMCFQVIAKVQEKTGVRLNPRLMLLNTLKQTAALLTQERGAGTAEPAPQDDANDKPTLDKPLGFGKKMLQ
jgi:amino acid adenylation domain-containing protein